MRYLQICISIGLVLCGFVTRVDAQSVENGDTLVVLGKDGFTPASVRVPVGTTVTFQTDRGRYFWPASDAHPFHAVYPAFDSKRPISPNEVWSFVFDTSGRWAFHDHISPYFTGVIEVVGESSQTQTAYLKIQSYVKDAITSLRRFIIQNTVMLNLSSCRNPDIDRNQRIACWERVVVSIVKSRGLQAALAFVNREKDRNISFAADCHIYVHRIGEEHYWNFFAKQRVEVSDKFDLCDFGFFHGFMQELTSHGTNFVEAKRYCHAVISLIDERDKQKKFSLQCYHGIGHGLAFLYASQFWENNEEIMRRGIADCRNLFPNAPRFCVSGVYGGLAAMYWGIHGFTLSFNKEDPFDLCKNQTMPDQSDCYDQLVPVVYGELGLLETGRIIEKLNDREVAGFLMEHLGSMPSYTLVPTTDDYSEVVTTCSMFQHDLASHCIRGFAAALIRIGAKVDGQKRAQVFCQSHVVTEAYKLACFDAAIKQVEDKYTKEDAARFKEDAVQ